jgi:hypothetical protein
VGYPNLFPPRKKTETRLTPTSTPGGYQASRKGFERPKQTAFGFWVLIGGCLRLGARKNFIPGPSIARRSKKLQKALFDRAESIDASVVICHHI